VRAIRSQHPFLGITLRNINKRGKGVEQDNLPDAKKGAPIRVGSISLYTRQKLLKPSQGRVFFSRPGKPHSGRKVLQELGKVKLIFQILRLFKLFLQNILEDK